VTGDYVWGAVKNITNINKSFNRNNLSIISHSACKHFFKLLVEAELNTL
jgi:hypothetical protein